MAPSKENPSRRSRAPFRSFLGSSLCLLLLAGLAVSALPLLAESSLADDADATEIESAPEIATPSDESPRHTEEGEPITVWGTQISSSSVYLGEDEIALEQVDHLSDLLRAVPGVDIGGTHSTNQRINIRGLGDRDLRVTLDGAVQNNYMFHHMGNLLFNTDILKAVDIQVGANSIVDGGLGGTVRFETKDAVDLLDPGQSFGGRLQGLYNSNASVGSGATFFTRLSDRVDLLAYAHRVDRDDFEDGAGVASSGNDGTTDNLLLKLGVRLGESQRLELAVDDLEDQGVYAPRPDFNGAANDRINDARGGHPYPTEYARQTVTLGYDASFGESTILRSSLYGNEMHLERDQDGSVVEGESTNDGVNVTLFSSLPAGRTTHALTYGVTANRQESAYFTDGAETGVEEATSSALFVEDRVDLGSGWVLVPGVRVDRYAMDTASSNETFTETSAALAAEYGFADAWTVLASATEVFKGPELAEIFIGGGDRKVPNPDLRPESGLNREVGLRYDATGVLGADSLTAHWTFFRTEIDDFIESVGITEGCAAGARCSQDQNVGTVEIDGYELSVHYARGPFGALLTFASSDSLVLETNEPLEREVGDSLSLSLRWALRPQRLELRWSTQVVFEEDHVIAGNPIKEGYEVHDIAAQWTPTIGLDGFSIVLGVDNLFDERYASHASRFAFNPAFGELTDFEPGRNFKATLSYAF